MNKIHAEETQRKISDELLCFQGFQVCLLSRMEEFVLSSNRRQLLQIENDTKDGQETKIELNSSIIYGSDKHLYFHLLQIENEITNILINNKDLNNLAESDSFTIISLLNEANDIILKYEETRNKNDDKYSNDVTIMTFRHKLRKLFLSPYIKMEQKQQEQEEKHEDEDKDIFDILIDKLEVKFNHSKPTDIITNNDDEKEKKTSSTMKEFDINKQFNVWFKNCEIHDAFDTFSTHYVA